MIREYGAPCIKRQHAALIEFSLKKSLNQGPIEIDLRVTAVNNDPTVFTLDLDDLGDPEDFIEF